MFPIKNFEEKREIVSACGAQSKIFDRSDLFFERDAQFLFLERLLAPKFNDTGLLRTFFLLLHDCPPRLLLILWSHNINCALSVNFKGQGHGAEQEEDSVSHVSENELDILASLENRHEPRHHR